MDVKDTFLQLVRLGIGCEPVPGSTFQISGPLSVEDWQALEEMANEHGLQGVMLDGMEKLPQELRPEKKAILQSIGLLIQSEQQYASQEHAANEMALLLHQHNIRTYVLKGAVVAECYPRPEHRRSVDMDCFLMAHTESTDNTETSQVSEDVWEKGNRVLEEQGFEVWRDFYKNSTIVLPGLMVENHRFLTPFRGNKTLRKLEIWMQSQFKSSEVQKVQEGRFEGTWLYRPPLMVSVMFLIEHAYSHFLHEGLTWRMVLDWQMFSKMHRQEIDWKELEARVDAFGFRRFYDSFCRLGEYLLGELTSDNLQLVDQRMLADIWAPLDVHETVMGFRGKLALASNTWRARWKYRHFTDLTWLQALWIQVKGVLLEREVRLI